MNPPLLKKADTTVLNQQVKHSVLLCRIDHLGLPELMQMIQPAGFELWAFVPAFADPCTGRLLQMDAVFFRPQG